MAPGGIQTEPRRHWKHYTLISRSRSERLRIFVGSVQDPPLPETRVSRAGDLWALASHRLLCGNATDSDDVKRLLRGVRTNLLISDPPYGVDYQPSAGVKANKAKLGRVPNDHRAGWREAVWHAGK